MIVTMMCRAHAAVTNLMPRIQHTKRQAAADVAENRLLPIAVEVINAAVKAARQKHLQYWFCC